MKINVLSDLHIENGEYNFPIIPSDLLVLAGDICQINKKEILINFLKTIPSNQRTIMVLGNHEYLFSDHNQCEFNMRIILNDFPQITLLENESIIIDDIEFIGSTLWTNFLAHGQEYYLASKEFIQKHWTPENAFIIENNQKINLTVDFAEQKSNIALNYLENKLNYKHNGKRVVISHFPPTKLSTELAYINDKLNSYWINDFDYLFKDISLWIHGHIHQSKNYIHPSGTHVVCNPRGNLKKIMNNSFDPNLIIEI